jgi:tetratricopeptide (TPR) repeat protein
MSRAGRRLRLAACLLAAGLLGCAGPSIRTGEQSAEPAADIELAAVPFFPQREYQCGPAALATVLVSSGVEVSPDELVEDVYLPGRKGSLQAELVGAARSRDRLPYVLPPNAAALWAELAAGHPVLVLQKLGAGPWPGWHYAVLVGREEDGSKVLLRSGTERRRQEPVWRFLSSWERAGSWALVVLPPGDMPAGAELVPYMRSAAGLEAVGRLDAAERAYRGAASRWPDAALPRLGLANLFYARGELRLAEEHYREAIALDPADAASYNNRAQVLLDLGCPETARRVLAQAGSRAAGSAHVAALQETRRRVEAASAGNVNGCPAQ